MIALIVTGRQAIQIAEALNRCVELFSTCPGVNGMIPKNVELHAYDMFHNPEPKNCPKKKKLSQKDLWSQIPIELRANFFAQVIYKICEFENLILGIFGINGERYSDKGFNYSLALEMFIEQTESSIVTKDKIIVPFFDQVPNSQKYISEYYDIKKKGSSGWFTAYATNITELAFIPSKDSRLIQHLQNI